MTALSIQPTFPIFTDIDGQPLENGYIWIGTKNLNPQTNPINVYWDAALTIQATQPIRTLAGYPSNSGTPARLYVNSDYSIRVQNRNGSMVYSAPAATERYGNIINANGVIYDPAGIGAVPTTVQAKLRETVSVMDFGAVGDGLTPDAAAFQLALNTGKDVYIPDATYVIDANLTPVNGQRIYGGGYLKSTILDNNVITISGKSNVTVDGISIETALMPGGVGGASENAIYIASSSDITVTNTKIIHKVTTSAIVLTNSSECKILGNTITCDGLSPSTLDSEIPDAVRVWDATRRSIISNNTINNTGSGISVQCLTASNEIEDVVIEGNVITDCTGYGIYLYGVGVDYVRRILINANVIKNIYGTYKNPATNAYAHGAGIYLLSAQDCVVSNNIIFNCNVSTDSETLSPGGIGMGGANRKIKIIGNHIEQAYKYGIIYDGYDHIVDGNTVLNCGKASLYSRASVNVAISNNSVRWDAGTIFGYQQGVLEISAGGGFHEWNTITGNHFYNCSVAVSADNADYHVIANNVIRNVNTVPFQCINIANGVRAVITGNIMEANGGTGIFCNNSESNIRDNLISGEATGFAIQSVGSNSYIGANRSTTWSSANVSSRIPLATAQWLPVPHNSENGVTVIVSGTGTIDGILVDPTINLFDVYIQAPAGTVLAHAAAGGGTNIPFKNLSGSNITVASIDKIYHYRSVGDGYFYQIT